MRAFVLALPLLLVACAGDDSGADRSADDAGATTPDLGSPSVDPPDSGVVADAGPATCPAADGETVTVTTDDDVPLEADLYTTGVSGGPGVVLLHMIPPFNDRSNYSADVIQAFVDRGINVLNLNRRGANGTDADLAPDAYEGPDGKWDAKAGVDFLVAHTCAIDPARVAVVGASNGTATAFDYAVYAAGQADRPSPAAVVFMTADVYTEANNRIRDVRDSVEALPILFVYSTDERNWSVTQQVAAGPAWQFEEYTPGDHGTRMFDAEPESIDDVADWVVGRL